LKKQDMKKAEDFWRKNLQGLERSSFLPGNNGGAAKQSGQAEHWRMLSEELTTGLQRLGQRRQLTMNTLVQGAWAILLSRYSGQRDVIFGATLSGRPPELAGAEGMVGLFINSLPLRVQMKEGERLLEWLRGLQQQQSEIGQYTYSPLTQVKQWSETPAGQPLFDTLIIFENYPIAPSLGQQSHDLGVRGM